MISDSSVATAGLVHKATGRATMLGTGGLVGSGADQCTSQSGDIGKKKQILRLQCDEYASAVCFSDHMTEESEKGMTFLHNSQINLGSEQQTRTNGTSESTAMCKTD
ncbi:uncharacterized [Tachysurus ichikawai]